MSGPLRPIVAIVSHVLNGPVRAVYDRIAREVPPDHDVRFILSTDDPAADLAGVPEGCVDRISRQDIFRLGYPVKCNDTDWDMAGNLDLVFLEFRRRHRDRDVYWFIEYDVHWEGTWSVFFERFRNSAADVLAATVFPVQDHPSKYKIGSYPAQVVPDGMPWDPAKIIKAFLPACRISARALDALGDAYAAGLGGHYEINVPSVPSQLGMALEDFGGQGRFVRPENHNRFYFARGDNYSHSPGTFVFRPAQQPLRRINTLWHPVKPEGVSVWHPLRIGGSTVKSLVESVKPLLWRAVIRTWFATRWRPLRTAQPAVSGRSKA